jgi:hypothetical protein
MSPAQDRDERLGTALRERRAPEPRPGFWEELEALLAEEATAAGPPGRRRFLSPPRARRWAVAAAVAAAVVAAVVIGVPRGSGPQPAAAAELKARVQEAVATLEDARIRGTWRDRWHGTVPFRLVLTSDGDVFFHQKGSRGVAGADAGRTITIAYDADRGVQGVVLPGTEGTSPVYLERRGVAPGPPDYDLLREIPVKQRLGAVIRALLAADDPAVSETTWKGREAWRAVIPVQPSRPTYPGDIDRLTVIVDRETGLPVQILGTRRGRFVERTDVRRLAVNEGVSEDEFRLRPSPGAEVHRRFEGFRRVTLAEAGAIVGYEPLVPQWLPDGYELAEVAAAGRGNNDLGDRWTRGVISLSYRRGFDQLVVTTRRAGGDPSRWSDPLDLGLEEGRERLELTSGALAGSRGELVLGPRELPHLWTVGEGRLLTVAGPLTRDELLRVAESLEAR